MCHSRKLQVEKRISVDVCIFVMYHWVCMYVFVSVDVCLKLFVSEGLKTSECACVCPLCVYPLECAACWIEVHIPLE